MFGRSDQDDAGSGLPDGRDAMSAEPPRGVSAALAGLVLDGKVGAREIAVMLVDLSVRGWFSMESDDGQWSLVTATSLPPRGAAPNAAEQLLLQTIFRPSPVETPGTGVPPQLVLMTTLRHRLQGHVEEIGERLGEEAVEAGLMTRNPARRSLRARGGLLTPAGQAVRDQAEAYRRYLVRAGANETATATSTADGAVDAALPYAIAFDVLPQWSESLAASGPAPSSAAAAMLHDLQNNPVLVGVAGSSGFSLADLTTLQLARNYGARFSTDHR